MNKVKGIQCEEVRNLETQVLVNVHRAIKDGNEHLDNVLNDKTVLAESLHYSYKIYFYEFRYDQRYYITNCYILR